MSKKLIRHPTVRADVGAAGFFRHTAQHSRCRWPKMALCGWAVILARSSKSVHEPQGAAGLWGQVRDEVDPCRMGFETIVNTS